MTGPRVLMALSGGVDSSVAAAVLIEEGYEVTGVTMRLWGGESDSGCCSVSDVEDARFVAHQLGIEHHVYNFADRFEAKVVTPYVEDHAAGRTPNPCIECNRHLKFDELYRRAEVLGFDLVATGHHARRVRRPDGSYRIARGADPLKDQSYVLYPLAAGPLARTLFPIGGLTKEQVRDRAAALGLRTAGKPDSQDVCFITATDGGRARFLGDRIPLTPGRLVDEQGRELGRVPAVQLVTIGQRRGLGLPADERRYVLDVDVSAGEVRVGPAAALDQPEVTLEQLVWAVDGPLSAGGADAASVGPARPTAVLAQVGAHGRPQPATVESFSGGRAVVRWQEPQRRVAPGQSVVLYEGDEVLGGGVAVAAPR